MRRHYITAGIFLTMTTWQDVRAQTHVIILDGDAVQRLPEIAVEPDRIVDIGAQFDLLDQVKRADQRVTLGGFRDQLKVTTVNGRIRATTWSGRKANTAHIPERLIASYGLFRRPQAASPYNTIGGQLDIQTVKTLDTPGGIKELQVSGRYAASEDDSPDTNGLGGAVKATYVDQFSDNTLGVALGYEYQDTSTVRTARKSDNLDDYWDTGANAARTGISGISGAQKGKSAKDHNFLGTIQWRPSESLEVNYELAYNKDRAKGIERGFEVNGLAAWDLARNDDHFYNATVTSNSGNNPINAGSINGEYLENSKTLSTSLAGKMSFADNLAVSLGADYSTASLDGRFMSVKTDNDVKRATYNGSGSTLTIDRDLTNVAQTNLGKRTIETSVSDDEIVSGYLDGAMEWDAGIVQGIKFGVLASHRQKSGGKFKIVTAPTDASATLDASLVRATSSLGSDTPDFLIFDYAQAADTLFGAASATGAELGKQRALTYVLDEKTITPYIGVDLSGSIAGHAYKAELGFRYARKSTEVAGATQEFVTDGGVVTGTKTNSSYGKILPSLHLSLSPANRHALGVSLARTLTEPTIVDLHPGLVIYKNNPTNDIIGDAAGNPKLDPWLTWRLSVNHKWEYGANAVLATELFYNKVDSAIVYDTVDVAIPGRVETARIVRPVNRSGGHVYGASIVLNQPLGSIVPQLNGFGVYAEYSYAQSNIAQGKLGRLTSKSRGIAGLSDHALNASLWYSVEGLDANLKYEYRSAYFERVNLETFADVKSAGYLSFNLGYSITPNLRFGLNAFNLTNEPYAYSRGGGGRLHQEDGRGLISFLSWTM